MKIDEFEGAVLFYSNRAVRALFEDEGLGKDKEPLWVGFSTFDVYCVGGKRDAVIRGEVLLTPGAARQGLKRVCVELSFQPNEDLCFVRQWELQRAMVSSCGKADRRDITARIKLKPVLH